MLYIKLIDGVSMESEEVAPGIVLPQIGCGITEAQELWITIQIKLMKLYLRFCI
jgi:hypothetical protein